jgi:hypothetical protein
VEEYLPSVAEQQAAEAAKKSKKDSKKNQKQRKEAPKPEFVGPRGHQEPK